MYHLTNTSYQTRLQEFGQFLDEIISNGNKTYAADSLQIRCDLTIENHAVSTVYMFEGAILSPASLDNSSEVNTFWFVNILKPLVSGGESVRKKRSESYRVVSCKNKVKF